MRKVIVVLSMLLVPMIVHAAQDREQSERPSLWRSTTTCHPTSFVLLSTGAIHLHAVLVDSATVNQGGNSFVALFNSTTTPNSQNAGNFLTTGTFKAANVMSGSPGDISPSYYDQYYSSGAVVNKLGDSCTTILWDHIIPKTWDAYNPWRP